MIRDFTGHGIGTSFHSGLIVPHYDDPSLKVTMVPGMTFTIEPMLTLGTIDFEIWPDGWTAVTKDRSLSRHPQWAAYERRTGWLLPRLTRGPGDSADSVALRDGAPQP